MGERQLLELDVIKKSLMFTADLMETRMCCGFRGVTPNCERAITDLVKWSIVLKAVREAFLDRELF